MGGINSKRKFLFKKSRKKKEDRISQERAVYMNEEPLYMEIEGAQEGDERDTVTSLDSAFSERTSSLNRSISTGTLIYDEPSSSLCSGTKPKLFDQTYLSLGAKNDPVVDVDGDDDDDDCTHTYISEFLLRETISNVSSITHCPTLLSSGCSKNKCNTSTSLEEVPYMVEAFQPLLEYTIDVMEIIPHLPFIDAQEFVRVDDPRKAVEMLIARIKFSNEPGKWQAFLHALNLTEYQYIVSLLRGETEEDHSVNRNLLKLFTSQIMNRIDPDEFIDNLFEEGVINERDMEEVKCEKDRRGAIAASFMLLHKVPRRVSNWFEVFLDVLGKCGLDDMILQFNIPEVSVCTKEAEKPIPRNEDQDYLTPVYHYERGKNRSKLPLPPPPPYRQKATTLPVRIPPSFEYVQAPRPETRKLTELEILKERKELLQRQVHEKKLVRRYKLEVEALQQELEKLNSGKEDSDTEFSEGTPLEQEEDDSSNGNCVLNTNTSDDNESLEEDNERTDFTELDSFNADTENVTNYVNENHGQESEEQTDQVQHISTLLTEMKQELKQDILAMRDHVTDAVLKSVINVITGSPSVEDDMYVTVETEQTYIPSPVQLYSSSSRQIRGFLSPKCHYMQRNYSVDSAMFSGFVTASDFSV